MIYGVFYAIWAGSYAVGYRPPGSVFAAVGNAAVIIYSNIESDRYLATKEATGLQVHINSQTLRWAFFGMLDVFAAIFAASYSPRAPWFCCTNLLVLLVCLLILAPLARDEPGPHLHQQQEQREAARLKEVEYWSYFYACFKEANEETAEKRQFEQIWEAYEQGIQRNTVAY